MSSSVDSESLLASRADALRLLGNASYCARRFTLALKHYSDALLLTPSNSVLWLNRSAAWMGVKRWEEARLDCERAIELDPTSDKANQRLEKINKEQQTSTSPPSLHFTHAHSLPSQSPNPSTIEVRSNLPFHKGEGLFALQAFQPGDELFTSIAVGVVLDEPNTNSIAGHGDTGLKSSRDLLHEVLIQCTIDPTKHASLWSLYPRTDDDLLTLPMITLDDTVPEEVDLYAKLCAEAPVGVHPNLIIPPYQRFVALTCGRFTPKQIHYLHHKMVYNATSDIFQRPSQSSTPLGGYGLYPSASALNHSCWPNAHGAILEGSEDRMTIRAIRPIHVGDEITLAYHTPSLCSMTRSERRKALAEKFDFVCQCERCRRTASGESAKTEDAPSTASSNTAADTDVKVAVISNGVTSLTLSSQSSHPGHLADDCLESIFCLSSVCTGSKGLNAVRGTMIRQAHGLSSKACVEEFDPLSGEAPYDYVQRVDALDTFRCRDCGHRVELAEVDTLVDKLTNELQAARQAYQANPNDVENGIRVYEQLLKRSESALISPSHHFLPQLYSALGGLYCRRSIAQRKSLPSSSASASSSDTHLVSMSRARHYANAAYYGIRRVLPPNHVLLIPLLLTLAACCDSKDPTASANAKDENGDDSSIDSSLSSSSSSIWSPSSTTPISRLSCVNEAYRIHAALYSGGLELFQQRFAADLNRLNITRMD